MRTSQASMALISRIGSDNKRLWLTQWNEKWQAFNLVGGRPKGSEDARDCCLREISEELQLRPEVDFVVAVEPLAVLRYEAFSQSAQELTQYEMTLFDVQLRDSAERLIEANPANRWLSEQEIARQQCGDGKRVSETTARLLRATGRMV
ncbi:MAG: NUDIX hydrolase [Gemmataceae bacterium]